MADRPENDLASTKLSTADEHPWRLAGRYAALCLVLFAAHALVYFSRYRRLLPYAWWRIILLIPVGMLLICVFFGIVASVIGIRRAQRVFLIVLTAALFAGVCALPRYLEHQK